ncbi:MAG: PHB depolymerase family esterase, partial [Pseudomonadota bacterium]
MRPDFFVKTIGLLASGAVACSSSHAVALPSLAIDANEVSVSGLSSGGFMAVQMHVAYSGTFRRGAGIVAGGPYFCAEGSIVNATGRCMTHLNPIPVAGLVSTTRQWAANGDIDPVSHLSNSKVYLYSGTQDNTVKPAVMNDLRTYYQSFVPAENVRYSNAVASGHAMITDNFGGACGTTATPFINDCDVDLAGDMLKHLHGALNPRNDGTLSGSFIEFDQTEFVSGHGMAATGWAYVPQSCASGARCKLHVVFHGCKQNTATIGQQYVRNTGYNRWADSNQMVVLYPQTSVQAVNSCWDWWGYDSPNYARKSGPQTRAVAAMVARLSGGAVVTPPPPPAALPAPAGVGTSGATSSSMVVAWAGVSGAAGYNVYRNDAKRNGPPLTGTAFTDTGLNPATTYRWSVTALDASGAESARSAPATGTTTAATGGGTATCTRASNHAHVNAGRARLSWGMALANGSNQNMGFWNIYTTTTLK